MAKKNKKNQQVEERSIQYRVTNGDTYSRCGKTVKTLKAGFYDVVSMGMGDYALQEKESISDELIDIPGTIADDIFTDIGKFLDTKPQYEEYGLTHKRGYLFYGPPGSGKTSLGMMLARRFVEKVDGIVMYCGDTSSFYNGVSIMRDVEPGRPSMYLIEEADDVVNNTHCLSILDGELSIQGAVFVAMTNYKERLPPRINNRPGRFDRVELVACPPEPVQLEYLRRVESRGGKNPDAPQRIVESLRGLPVSMAHLREAFISHVLMGVPLDDLRKRFEIMAGVRDEDGKLIEGDESEDSDDEEDVDDERENRIYDAQVWEPGD